MTDIRYYDFPTSIHAGPGARTKLAEALEGAGAKRPLLLTDKGLAELPPIVMVAEQMQGFEVARFIDIWGNPVESQVKEGVEAFKTHGADSIVAVGGGAALDVAKCVALMAHHPGNLFDYLDGDPNAKPIDKELPALIGIPTTAGTGSEVGRSAVISEDDTHAKKIIYSPRLLPGTVLADPELTLGLPAGITAATGMDALTHLVEAYVAKGVHPICDGIALEGVRLVARSLERVVAFAKDPGVGSAEEHLQMRDLMLHAAMMGAIAFQKGLGVTHSLAHALSTVCDLHHGLANGILIPYTMGFNVAAVPERFAMLAQAAGLPNEPAAFVDWLRGLKDKIGIPATLSEVGVRQDQVEALVEFAEKDGCKDLNPRPVSRDDLQALYVQALGG